MDNVQNVIARAKAVKGKQGDWLTYWDDLARVHIPRMLGFSETREVGERHDDLFDGTPMHAARGLANSIGGLLRPDGEDWVRVKAVKEDLNNDYDAKIWLEDTGDRLRKAMENPRSRMRQCTGEVDLMLTVFGTGPFWLGENRDRNGLLYQAIHLKDAGIDWGESGPRGMYRFKKLTASQAADEWGVDNLGEQAKRALKEDSGDKDRKFTYINAVMQRNDAGRFRSRMPYASLWIEEESNHIVANSGFVEFPYIVPRMDTAPGEDYGRSPAMIALPDSNTAQAMGETILIAGQRAADPPIFAPNDGSFSAANTFPGGISYYDAELATKLRGNPIFPMESGHSLPITRDMQHDTREQIFAAFFKNILNLPIAGPQMTATEVIRRQEEMKREISPLFGRLEADYTGPMVERTFNIMMRAFAFSEVPDVLAGENVTFEYESPINRVRQMIEVEAARAYKDEMISLVEVKPDIMDNFDGDAYAEVMQEALKAPEKLRVDPAIRDENRAIRAAKEAEIEKQNQIAGAADVLKTGAEAANAAGMV